VLNDFDSDIKFSEMGSSDKEEIDSDVDTVLADIAIAISIDNASGN
jgi:hypothetical protein